MQTEDLQALGLGIVVPGTRSGFRRRVLDALLKIAPASYACMFMGTDEARAYGDALHLVDGEPVVDAPSTEASLKVALGLDLASIVMTPRRVYSVSELYSEAERAHLPFFQTPWAKRYTEGVLLFFHEGGLVFGVAGLFSEKGGMAAPMLEMFAPYVVSGLRAQLQYDELSREAAAMRALARVRGPLYVVDRDKKRVLFAVDRGEGIRWEEDVAPFEAEMVEAALAQLQGQTGGIAKTPPALERGTVVQVRKFEDAVFGSSRCVVVQLEAPSGEGPKGLSRLSRREREIARLLVSGYSGVNVAAISGLSENTVRTYVRRLYTKLGVNNRADLVRKLMAPEPSSRSVELSPPPDSSLAHGDDTLD